MLRLSAMTETSTIAGDDPPALEVAGSIRGGDVPRLQQLLAAHPDVEVLDALLDAGAEIDAGGAVIARGTPLQDAVAFGQWIAGRLAEGHRRAALDQPAAALGLVDVVAAQLGDTPDEDISMAFWYACHGGRHATAEPRLEAGADINRAAPWDGLTPLDAALRSGADELGSWLRSRGARAADAG